MEKSTKNTEKRFVSAEQLQAIKAEQKKWAKLTTCHKLPTQEERKADRARQKEEDTTKLLELYTLRNKNIDNVEEFAHYNEQITLTLAPKIAYSTLSYMISPKKNGKASHLTDNAVEFLEELKNSMYYDIQVIENKVNDTITDSIDILQEARLKLWEELKKPIEINTDTILLTIKEKNYNLFGVVSKHIREHINKQSERDAYKRLYIIIGVDDNGNDIIISLPKYRALKKKEQKAHPKPLDQTLIQTLKQYNLTSRQEQIALLKAENNTLYQIAELLNVSYKTVKRDYKVMQYIMLQTNKPQLNDNELDYMEKMHELMNATFQYEEEQNEEE